jgi:hypothetical protein
MKVVILAGGFGTRLSEETDSKPKPMVQIGGREMLWHIMQGYAHYGLNEFVIALGYKGEMIKRYFLDYRLLNSSLTVSLATGEASAYGGECPELIRFGAVPYREWDPPFICGDNRRLRGTTGWQPRFSTLSAGLCQTVDWWKARPAA